MNSNSYQYTKISESIWQIAEDEGVYCTLIKGKEMAALIDTGYGKRNLRAFLEANISTPYIVINSHGHPDHIGGNHWFDTVYALREEWDVIRYFEENRPKTYVLKEIQYGQQIILGDISLVVVPLAGHTRGSVGFFIPEEKLLVAGDALNEGLWLFNYGSLGMEDVYETIKKTMALDFTSYLCGHSDKKYKKEKLLAHIRNIENLKLDACTRQDTIGFETYCSRYEDSNGSSELVFTIDKVRPQKSRQQVYSENCAIRYWSQTKEFLEYADKTERCKSIEKLTDNPFLNLYHIDAVTRTGKAFSYYFASRNPKEKLKAYMHGNQPEGISIYAVRKENPGQIVMLRQFRYPINDYMYEIPAGLVDAGETPAQSAVREMKEETGLSLEVYEGGDDCFRRPFFLAQGLTDESGVMVYGYAVGEISTAGQEESEDIEVLFVDRKQARRILAREKVSVRAAYMLMNFIHAEDAEPFAFLE